MFCQIAPVQRIKRSVRLQHTTCEDRDKKTPNGRGSSSLEGSPNNWINDQVHLAHPPTSVIDEDGAEHNQSFHTYNKERRLKVQKNVNCSKESSPSIFARISLASSHVRQNSTKDELCTKIGGGHPSAKMFSLESETIRWRLQRSSLWILAWKRKQANKCRLTAHLHPSSNGSRHG